MKQKHNISTKILAAIVSIAVIIAFIPAIPSEIASAEYMTNVTLQQGLNGYSGAMDVANISKMVNYGSGAADIANCDSNNGMLLFFDLSQIPSDAIIDSAALSLYANHAYGGTWGSGSLQKVIDPQSRGMWTEGTNAGGGSQTDGATGFYRKAGLSWANGDFLANSLSSDVVSLTIPQINSYQWFTTPDISADVQGFVSDPVSNQGWWYVGYLQGIMTKENEDTLHRPKLDISYHMPGTTPDPTEIPTNTPVVTVTSTQTPTQSFVPTPSNTAGTSSPTAGTSTPRPTTNPTLNPNPYGGKTYYVSPGGSDSNNGLSYDKPKQNLQNASRMITAGDTLILEGGTYGEGENLWPAYSGTADKPVTIKAADGETPVLTGKGSWGCKLTGSLNYYIIDGLTFTATDGDYSISASGVTNLVIQNCAFNNQAGMVVYPSHYVTIQNCYFDTAGTIAPGSYGQGDNIYMNGTDHSVVQNNYFTKGGHACIDLIPINSNVNMPDMNVVRNNTIYAIWSTGIGVDSKYRNLIEDNTIYYAGAYMPGYPKCGINIMSCNSIFRRNIVGWNGDGSFNAKYPQDAVAIYPDMGFSNISPTNNKIYNNVIYKSGYHAFSGYEKAQGLVKNNKIFNNIMYNDHTISPYSNRYEDAGNWVFGWSNIIGNQRADDWQQWNTPEGFFSTNEMYNNEILYTDPWGKDNPDEPIFFFDGAAAKGAKWGKTLAQMEAYSKQFHDNYSFNPDFVNADAGDFRLDADSPAIDAGAHMTKTTNTDALTTSAIPVADASYFFDGYGIAGQNADVIKVGSNDNVQVTSIDYTKNVINVSSEITINPGDNVDLMYSGSAPDLGVYEYDPASTAPPVRDPIPTPSGWTPPTPSTSPTQTPTPKPTLTPTPAPTPVPFTDLNGFDWAKQYIDKLSATGVIHGYSDMTFKPGNTITRAEFATMITGAYQKVDSSATTNFTDVPADQWYYKYVASAEKEQLVQGKGDNTFLPLAEITREEMFTINARALAKYNGKTILSNDDPQTTTQLNNFVDGSSVSDWAKGYVATNIQLGIVTGSQVDGGKAIKPQDPIRRAEVAVVLGREYNIIIPT